VAWILGDAMVRGFVLALLGAVALAAGSSAQQPANNLVMAPGHIGPVKARITEAELKALPFPIEQGTVMLGDTPLPRYVVQVDANNTVVAKFYGRNVTDVRTTSKGFATAEGAHVGASLGELQKLYPKGELMRADEEEGRLAFYPWGLDARPHLGFDFPVDGLPLECLAAKSMKACPDLSGRISISASTN